MSATEVELCLATLFSHADSRREFLQAPEAVLKRFDLSSAEREAMLVMDKAGLVLAGNSFSAKRSKYKRWMHSSVKSMVQFENLVNPVDLERVHDTVLSACKPGRPMQDAAARFLERADMIPWDREGHHNREHMLEEAGGLDALAELWSALRSGVLLNHHLLRCYAIATVSPSKATAHREHPRPGVYMTYVILEAPPLGEPAGELVALYENKAEVVRFNLARHRAFVLPADVLHRFDTPPGAQASLLLVFKSLAAIQ